MSYCRIHGKHYYEDGCPTCRAAEEQAESDRSATLEMLGDLREVQGSIAGAINNPGDFTCPYCRLRTLLRDASCCPKCQKDIGSDYWDQIRNEEELKRKHAEKIRRHEAAARKLEAKRLELLAREEAERLEFLAREKERVDPDWREREQRDRIATERNKVLNQRINNVAFAFIPAGIVFLFIYFLNSWDSENTEIAIKGGLLFAIPVFILCLVSSFSGKR